MKKRVLILLALLALAGVYAMTANAQADNGAPDPTQTAPTVPAIPSPTATPETCKVYTGIEGGQVNLRACEGAVCGAALAVVTEGEILTIITAGEYVNVTTKSGVTGWLHSKYCTKENKP